tara:strand:- start:2595 stop:3749 length:1155 start_codon:yes stop_codon:yes gene_type:complete
MVGETIKIGFDGTSVKRGMSGIMGNFNKLGRGIGRATRQVGIGAARRMGSDLFGIILQSLKAIPNELDSLSKLNKEMRTMGMSTGIAAKNYLALREAIAKTTGLDPDEAVDFIKDVSERLGEAAADPKSTPAQGLSALGFSPSEMRSLALEDPAIQLEKIAGAFKRIKESTGSANAMFQINEVLGEIGKKMIPLFINWDKGMKSATEKTKGLHAQIERLGGDLESIFDIKSAIGRKFSELALSLFEGVKAAGVEAKSIAEWINNLKVSENSKSAGEFIAKQMKDIERQGPLDWIIAKMAEIGEWIAKKIGEGIKLGIESSKEILKELMPSINPFKGSGGTLKSLLGFKPDKSSADNGKGIERNTGETNNILRRIADGGSIATYA